MHVIVWEFKAKAGSITEFESAYGSAGDWAQFFSRGTGYLGTRLLRDSEEASTYVTFDRWASRQDYETFQRVYGEEYRKLDVQFELLTEAETYIGAFEKADAADAMPPAARERA
jgi:heme-degrading monooxygenase HmoA